MEAIMTIQQKASPMKQQPLCAQVQSYRPQEEAALATVLHSKRLPA